MLLNSLLEVSESATNIVMWISVGAAVLLLGVIAAICFKGGKKYDAKHIAAAGVTLALSFGLSYVKVSPVTYGGSITLASFVPVLIYAYVYGVVDGLLAGLIFGLLNFISGPYILTPMTFILDYLLAFASIGFMGFARKFSKKTWLNVLLGTIGVYVLRFIFHLISGVIYFQQDAIWVELPDWAVANAFIYSFIYQCVYIPADCAISAAVLFVLAMTKVLDRLIKIIAPKEKKVVAEAEVDAEGGAEFAEQTETPAEDKDEKEE